MGKNPQTPQNAAPEGFDEVGAELFKFNDPGDSIEGTLYDTDEIAINDKPVTRIYIRTFNSETQEDENWAVLLTENLRQKLVALPMDTYVRIVYEAERKLAGSKKFRTFKVYVKRA